MTTRLTFTALAALAALGFASTTLAASDPSSISVRVSYGDLDLSSRAGAKVMIARIDHAAKSICGAQPGVTDLASRGVYASCVKDVVDRSVRELDRPMVTAMNAGHTAPQLASSGR